MTPSRIEHALKRRRRSRRDLAAQIGVADKTVERWIKGSSEPEDENLEKMAAALDFPVDFFSGRQLEEIDHTKPSFRARRSSKRLLEAASQSAAIAFEIERALAENLGFELPPLNLPELPDACLDDPELAALRVRDHWGLRDRPIRRVVGVLEFNGIRVFSLPSDMVEGKVSAFCVENANGTPFVLLNTRDATSGERTRFDASHELGHIILHRHRDTLGPNDEPEADRFASAFLMPRNSVMEVAHRAEPSIACLAALKRRWGVSVAALARRFFDVGVFSKRQYRCICIELSRYGRRREPNAIPGEASRLLPRIVEALRKDGGLSVLSALSLLHEDELNEYLFGLTMLPVVRSGGGRPPEGPEPTTKRPGLSLVGGHT